MPQATIRASWFGGSTAEPAGANAETGVNLDRSDIQVGQEPLPIPLSAPNTVYGAIKQVALEVMTPPTPATTISYGTVRASGAMPTGAAWFYTASTSYLAQLAAATTVSGSYSAGSSTIQSVATFSINDLVQIGSGSSGEIRKVIGVGGSGPYTLTLDRPTSYTHTSGEQVARFVSGGPADVGSVATGNAPTVPSGYTLPTTTPVAYDAMGLSTSTLGRKGQFVRLLGALSSGFGTSPGIVTMPSAIVAYDES